MITSSIVPAMRNAASGYLSISPSMIALNPSIVSFNGTYLPLRPVKFSAQADLEVTKIQADAAEYAGQKEAAKNKAIAQSLTAELVRYYYIQQWDGKLPTTMLGENMMPLFELN